ncbi:uncharacterized protein K02A2.6-like [Galendromus occidentalis]|uniref:Uncharacterized protein K02A2.6-like n=1 Tax=Galendromus occidentalis TaxID=34638 RepID=A0AAJ6QM42_9ACAR|nr:uncharacterized protein K02A2.6-like [Galendromus occidentalis]
MGQDIEAYVKSCGHCIKNAADPIKVPLQPWPDTQEPWSRIHLDFAEPQKGKTFLVIVDSFSKFVDAAWLSPATSRALVAYLRNLSRLFGPPDTMVSDKGGQFVSVEFAKLCADFNIIHLRCAPRCPQSNGQAERMVGTLKNSITSDPASLDAAVAAYNYTPNSTIGNETPAEVFFGREIRTPLEVLARRPVDVPRTEGQEKMEAYYNRHHGAKPRSFSIGETVTIALFFLYNTPYLLMNSHL